MKLLHVTDTHLGIDRWYQGAPPGWRRSDDHLAALALALAPARRGEVDLVVHSGDLFDRSRAPAKAVVAAAALFADVASVVPVLLLPGNHDARGLGPHFPTPIPGVQIVDQPTRVSIAGVAVAVVPYFKRANDWAAAAAPFAGVDLLVCHQSFHGCYVPGYTFRPGGNDETVAARQVPRVGAVLCGHIHTRQTLDLGQTRVVFPGSSERTSFTERHETKGYATWELGATFHPTFVDLPTRPMQVVRVPADLDGVSPGCLVHVSADDPAELEVHAFRRGAYVTGRAAPSAQVPLFRPG